MRVGKRSTGASGVWHWPHPCPLRTTVFGIGYAIVYPSFWFYGGTSGWSSGQQYESQVKIESERYAPLQAAAQAKALEALKSLSKDEATLKAGSEVFQIRCAPCHGSVGSTTRRGWQFTPIGRSASPCWAVGTRRGSTRQGCRMKATRRA